jgi:ABC-type transport system involved in cytochrome bd biosynthesis fused ATPase/permease subunit
MLGLTHPSIHPSIHLSIHHIMNLILYCLLHVFVLHYHNVNSRIGWTNGLSLLASLLFIGLSIPSKSIGAARKSSSSSSHRRAELKEEAAAIVNETNHALMFGRSDHESGELLSSKSFLSDIFDDQSINDLLNGD